MGKEGVEGPPMLAAVQWVSQEKIVCVVCPAIMDGGARVRGSQGIAIWELWKYAPR